MNYIVDYSKAIELGEIEKDDKIFCTVYLYGRNNNNLGVPKVIGIDHRNKSDFEIKEEAINIINGSLIVNGVCIVY